MGVRLAMPEDRDAVLSLAKMQVEETLPHLEFREDLTSQAFSNAVSKGDPLCLVYEGPHGISGMLWARIYDYAFASGVFVSQEVVYVRPDKRGTRAAVQLLLEYIRWGGEDVNAREILFGISNGRNTERVARLFEKLGAQRVGTHHRIVRANG